MTVRYSKGLARQAECFADLVAKQLSYVRDTTALEFAAWARNVDVYLKLADAGGAKTRPGGDIHVWDLPLFVDPDKTSCEDIIQKNESFYAYTWMHELVEFTLATGKRPRTLVDYRHQRPGGGTRDELHYTRWFREGFASYCGILACRAANLNDGAGGDEIRSEMFNRTIYLAPFSSLARVGKRLFAWHQYDDYADYEPDPIPPGESPPEASHYDAALALFLVIEDRYGQHAIRQIMQEVNKLKNGTGEDLKRIAGRVLGTDIVKLVEGFRFPDTGLDMVAVYPPHPLAGGMVKEGQWVARVRDDSPAQRAGMKRDDVVLTLDGERTITNFEFECALHKHLRQGTVNLGIWRKATGHMTVEMKLGN